MDEDKFETARPEASSEAGADNATNTKATHPVDDDRVPVDPFEVVPILPRILQCVDRDEDALVEAERVACRRDLLPHPLNTLGVQADTSVGDSAVEDSSNPRPTHLDRIRCVDDFLAGR